MASIDINDIDVRTLALTVTGTSGSEIVSVALKPPGAAVLDTDYTVVSWTDAGKTSVDLPFGEGFPMPPVGEYVPSVKVTDSGNVATATGGVRFQVTDRTQGT